MIPANALAFLPLLLQVQLSIWPDAPIPSFLAAQIEQESCISLRHPKCWNPKAELKTPREYGFGFGQITKAMRADGSVRFDKFAELKTAHSSLAGWTWSNRFDPSMQMIALVEMDKAIFRRMPSTAKEPLEMALSAYNGGEGGLGQDRTACRFTPHCDPDLWFDNVELTSTKSRVKWQGYGKSAFEINREYVRNVMLVRREKYIPYMEKQR